MLPLHLTLTPHKQTGECSCRRTHQQTWTHFKLHDYFKTKSQTLQTGKELYMPCCSCNSSSHACFSLEGRPVLRCVQFGSEWVKTSPWDEVDEMGQQFPCSYTPLCWFDMAFVLMQLGVTIMYFQKWTIKATSWESRGNIKLTLESICVYFSFEVAKAVVKDVILTFKEVT